MLTFYQLNVFIWQATYQNHCLFFIECYFYFKCLYLVQMYQEGTEKIETHRYENNKGISHKFKHLIKIKWVQRIKWLWPYRFISINTGLNQWITYSTLKKTPIVITTPVLLTERPVCIQCTNCGSIKLKTLYNKIVLFLFISFHITKTNCF
jgi:hypothetical protein